MIPILYKLMNDEIDEKDEESSVHLSDSYVPE
jgi:hypothetical protein